MTGGVFVLRLVILVVQGRLFGLDIVTLANYQIGHCVHLEVRTLPLFERITFGSWLFEFAVSTFCVDLDYGRCPKTSLCILSSTNIL